MFREPSPFTTFQIKFATHIVTGLKCAIRLLKDWYLYAALISHYQEKMEISEPRHEKNLFMSHANNKNADQPAHPHNLTSVFNVRCLDSIISLVHLSEISSGCAVRF